MDKIVLDIETKPIKSGLVRLSPEAFEIVRHIQEETGISASRIVSEFIKFGSKNFVFAFSGIKKSNTSYIKKECAK